MVKIHRSAVVDSSVKLGDEVSVGPNCVIGEGTSIGSGTTLDANVVIGKNVTIGKGNRLFPHCVIGGQPQVLGINPDNQGGLIIGDNNVIRENVTIHPSMHKEEFTKIGNDNLLMIGVHIGHDCIIEDKIVMSNFVQVSGHCKIETGVWLSGMVVMHQFITVGKWSYAAGLAGLNRDVPPYMIISGHYPPVVRGVNKRGMGRAGLSEESQKKVFEAYKKLYRGGGAILEKAEAIAGEEGLDEEVKAVVDSILRSGRHRFGRYLETFRR